MFKELNVQTPKQLFEYLSKYFKYGFVYRNKIFTDDNIDFQKNMDKLYKIRLGKDFIKNKYGVCWDFCEFERSFFIENKIEYSCYFIESILKSKEGGPTHTFLLFKQNGKWYWFEYSWLYYRGIWEYSSQIEAIQDIIEKFKNFYNKKIITINIYKTAKVTKRLDVCEFVKHCTNGNKLLF